MAGRRYHSGYARSVGHHGTGFISAVFPYQTLTIPYHASDAVREALLIRAGAVGRTDPQLAEKLRDIARQLK